MNLTRPSFALGWALALAVVGCGDDGESGDDATTMATDPTTASTATTTMMGSSTGSAEDESTGGAAESTTAPADGSSGDEGSTTAALPDVDYAADIQPIFNAACTCHLMGQSGMMTAPVLTLNEGMSYDMLVGPASTQATALQLVAPGDLDNSYLWRKLEDTHLDAGGSGTVMPQVGMLEDNDLNLIRAWILQGAMQ